DGLAVGKRRRRHHRAGSGDRAARIAVCTGEDVRDIADDLLYSDRPAEYVVLVEYALEAIAARGRAADRMNAGIDGDLGGADAPGAASEQRGGDLFTPGRRAPASREHERDRDPTLSSASTLLRMSHRVRTPIHWMFLLLGAGPRPTRQRRAAPTGAGAPGAV